jgi:hypothetical protein
LDLLSVLSRASPAVGDRFGSKTRWVDADYADNANYADCSDVRQDLQLKAGLGSAVAKSFAVQLLLALFFQACRLLQLPVGDSGLRIIPFESA